jgi:hypothetical protein
VKAARAINLGLSSIGVAIFAALLLYVTLAPKDFDRRTRDFAIARVEGKVQDKSRGPVLEAAGGADQQAAGSA